MAIKDMDDNVTIIWYDGNNHRYEHGYFHPETGSIMNDGKDFPPDAQFIATIQGHVKVTIWGD